MPAKKKKIVKKSTPKTTPKTSPVAKTSLVKDPEKRSALVWGVVTVLLLAFIFAKRDFFIAATVNGKPIWRNTVVRELEKRGGRQELDALITRELILGEAKKKNVQVNQEEIAKEIDTIKKSVEKEGQKLDQLLATQGLTQEDLKDQILISKTVEKLFANDIKVATTEVDAFLEANAEAIQPEASPEAARANAESQLKQQKLNQKAQELITRLRKEAKINYFVKY